MATAKYMEMVVPFCPNCGRKMSSDGTEPLMNVEGVNNFFKNRVDRVHMETFPDTRQIGVKKIRIVKQFTRGKNKGKKTKPMFREKPIMETVEKTTAKCGLCNHELTAKALRKKFNMVVVEGQLKPLVEPSEAPPTEAPPSEAPKKEEP